MYTYHIYTDGACSGNPGPGGWAFAVYTEANQMLHEQNGGENDTTNNQMELIAMIKAFEFMHAIGNHICYKFYTDSAYIHNCFKDKWYLGWIKNGWRNSKKQPVANKHLWQQLIKLYEDAAKDCFFFDINKVEGHSTNEYNNYVDKMAVQACQRIKETYENQNNLRIG